MRRLAFAIVALLLALSAGMAGARAQNLMDRMLIFDLSQSMWAPVGGDHRRYEVAKSIGERLVREMAAQQPGATVGLVALGHQFAPKDERACEDVALIAPPTELASASAADRLARLAGSLPRPMGKTPLTEAVRRAAGELDEGGVLIIVSDFQETCDEERHEHPCDAFAEMQRNGELDGVEIRYIVAIADAADNVGRMSEYARCTGAQLVRADSPDAGASIAAAIAADLKRLAEPLDLTVRFKLDRDTDIPPAWGAPPLDGNVTVAGASGGGSAAIESEIQTFSLIGGVYTVTATIGGRKWTALAVLESEPGLAVDVKVPAARVALSVVGPEGEAVSDGAWKVTGKNGGAASAEGAAAGFDLPPGNYRIEVRSSLGGKAFDLELKSGDDIRRQLTLDAALQMSARATIRFAGEAAAPSLFAGRAAARPELLLTGAAQRVVRIGAQAGATEIEPGRYDAAIAWGGGEWPIAPVDLPAGKEMTVAVKVSPGAVEATYAGSASEEVVWRVRSEDGDEEVQLRGARLSQSLPPGTYLVRAELDGEAREQIVTVGIGTVERIVLTR